MHPIEKLLQALSKAYPGEEIPIPEHLYGAITTWTSQQLGYHSRNYGPYYAGKKLVSYNDTAANRALQSLNIGSLFGVESVETDGIRIQFVESIDVEPKPTVVVQTNQVIPTNTQQVKPTSLYKRRSAF